MTSRESDLEADHRPLPDRAYWGTTIDEERYVVVGRPAGSGRPKQRDSGASL